MFDEAAASDLEGMACHEAGHAVVAARLGLRVRSVEIQRTTDGLLAGNSDVDLSTASPAIAITVYMAGWAAEEMLLGSRSVSRQYEGSDEDEIDQILAQVDRDQRQLLKATAKRQAKRMVKAHRTRVVALAEALLRKVVMAGRSSEAVEVRITGDELSELLGG